MIRELEEKYDVRELADLDDVEKFEIEKLRPIYKITNLYIYCCLSTNVNCFYNFSLRKKDAGEARKMAINLMFDEEGDKEKIANLL